MPSIDTTKVFTGIGEWVVKPFNSSNPPTLTFPTATSMYIQEKRTSFNTVGFRKWRRRNKTTLPMQPFSYSKTIDYGAVGSMESYIPTAKRLSLQDDYERRSGIFNQGSGFNTLSLTPSLPQSVRDSVERRVSNKVLLELKNQKINLAQLYAERAQTDKLLWQTADRVASCLHSLKKGNFMAAANALGVVPRKRGMRRFNSAYAANGRKLKGFSQAKEQREAMASGWLELQYGWQPLLNDLYGAMEALADVGRKPYAGKVVKKEKYRLKPEWKTVDGNDPLLTYTANATVEYSVKYTLHYETDAPHIQSLASLGILNPAVIAWELMPFSFVADWFLPVGNWLNTWDATLGLSFVKGCRTEFYRAEGTCHKFRNGTYNNRFIYWNQILKRSAVTCDRTILVSFPFPSWPQFKNPLSIQHFANAFALITQLTKK